MKYVLCLLVILIPATAFSQIHCIVNEVNSTYLGNKNYTMGGYINVCNTPLPIVNSNRYRVEFGAKVVGTGAAFCGTRNQMPTQTSGLYLDQSGMDLGREGVEEWLCVSISTTECVDINVVEVRFQYPSP